MTLGEQVQAYEKPFSSLKELAIIRVETHPRKQTHETTGNSLADQCAKQFAPIQVHRSEDGLLVAEDCSFDIMTDALLENEYTLGGKLSSPELFFGRTVFAGQLC
ncbi:Map/Microtubule Affinity-Regulating Kinase 3 [Manis pentadactyla]|nr:Map/Microtubule Affinity-Regulating Kinase 3 [Manis pentadactyla]KAI5271554.1 Map/Microtubule Affinity-Regulating Kinase 3 [Manis pentadactyla]